MEGWVDVGLYPAGSRTRDLSITSPGIEENYTVSRPTFIEIPCLFANIRTRSNCVLVLRQLYELFYVEQTSFSPPEAEDSQAITTELIPVGLLSQPVDVNGVTWQYSLDVGVMKEVVAKITRWRGNTEGLPM